jgi:D-alanyl-D-alanine dipeptidase
MIVIPDEELVTIPIEDNHEALVDMRTMCPGILVDIMECVAKHGGKVTEEASFVRRFVADMLNKAQATLPKGFKLAVGCGYRSPKLQKSLYDAHYKIIQKENPEWNEQEVKKETDKWIAPLEIVPPHCTGGAVDLSIINAENTYLNMGTPLDVFNEKTISDHPGLTQEQKKNRDMLFKAMNSAGFINYPLEWWHWTYGDRYWAAVLGKSSIYNIKE